MLIEKLAQSTAEKCQVSKDEKLLVGVSGGADSLALMHGLDSLGLSLVVAHLDHGLRAESSQDAEFVRMMAELLDLPFIEDRVDVAEYADRYGKSIEEAAREMRYRFLFDVANQEEAGAVAVAHHADDQVETVLMHFLRGSALSGLTGMDYRKVLPVWDPEIPLVRPLLGTWRIEIIEYLAQVGWAAVEDESNKDTTFFRNKLRHDLIPELEIYNPQIRQVLWRMTEALREDEHMLAGMTEEAWLKVFVRGTKDHVALDHTGFLKLPKAIQGRVLMQAISTLRSDLRDVGYEVILRGLAFAEQPTERGEIDLVGRLNLVVLRDVLVVKTWGADLPDWGKPLLADDLFLTELAVEKPLVLRNGWQIAAQWKDQLPEDWREQVRQVGPYEAWLDGDKLVMPLLVRGRQEGERWQPLGMDDQHQSFQDFFITQKVPEHLRDIWPLVCSGDDVAWVVGMRPSEAFKVTDETKRVLQLRLVKMGE